MKIKKLITAVTIAALSMTAAAGCKGSPDDSVPSISGLEGDASETAAETEESIDESKIEWLPDTEIRNFIQPEIGEKIAVITVKDYGTIKIKLFPDQTPKAVENFIGHAESGYYDELIFHRVIKDFMNQTGDPKGDGTGGKSIWGEEFEGELGDGLYHFSGAVAYAHTQYSFTNGSQFYIVNTPEGFTDMSCAELYGYDPAKYNWPANVAAKYKEAGGVPFLDGDYTVFGQVFEGMDVVRAIAEAETNPDNDKPLTQVIMESVRIEEYQG